MIRRLLLLTFLSALAACGGGGGGGDADIGGPGTAILTWTASPSPLVTGYRVYHGTAPRTYLQARGSGIVVGRVQRHVVTGLSSGVLYYFAVTAIDDDGNESVYSNEASKLVE